MSQFGSVELLGVTKMFDAVVAVDEISLRVEPGEFLTLLGPSGCGKTTTLRMIAGFEHPTTGRILIDGVDAAGMPPFRRNVNTVFQNYALFPHMSVADNVGFGLKMKRVPRSEIRARVKDALELVRLGAQAERRPHQLSGGQQQRVALARAVVNHPAVLLLDEPLGALDLKLRQAMQLELKSVQQQLGITFIYVTHDQEEALTMSDRIAVMAAGRMLQIGPPPEIYNHPSSRFVADFIGETNFLMGKVAEATADVVTVGIEGIGMLQASGVVPAGAEVVLAIRPETIRIVTDGELYPNMVEATIVMPIFRGSDTRLLVRLANGQECAVEIPNQRSSEENAFLPGNTIQLGWDLDGVSLLTS